MPNVLKEKSDVRKILQKVVEVGASDLHLTASLPPTVRIAGVLQPMMGYDPLAPEEISNFIGSLLDEQQLKHFLRKKDFDFSYSLEKNARFRVNVFFEKGNMALAARLIPLHIPTIEELNLPHILYEFCKLPQGLVLITGATGTGKSTTLAGMINWINHHRNSHIITVEDPIEFIFESNKSLIQQREMYIDTNSWAEALKHALREDPEILLVGEMRDYETIASAITAAETGHLVLASLHTNSASQTIDRIIDVFPEHQQSQVRIQLSSVIEGIIAQTLVRGIDNDKRFPAVEILIANTAVRNTIREGNAYYIDNIIRTSFDLGMRTMESSLAQLVNEGKVELEEAQSKTLKPDEIVRYLNAKQK